MDGWRGQVRGGGGEGRGERLHRHVQILSHESRQESHDALCITLHHIISHHMAAQRKSKGTVNIERRSQSSENEKSKKSRLLNSFRFLSLIYPNKLVCLK